MKEHYDEVADENRKKKARVADDVDRGTAKELKARQAELWEEQKKAREALKKNGVFVKFELNLFDEQKVRQRLNNNLFGENAGAFLKLHLDKIETPDDYAALARVCGLLKKEGSPKSVKDGKPVEPNPNRRPLPLGQFADLERAFLKLAGGKNLNADDRDAVDRLKKYMGDRERPDRKPWPDDYGNLWWGSRAKADRSVKLAAVSRAKKGKPARFSGSGDSRLMSTQIQASNLDERAIFAGKDRQLQAVELRTLKRGKVKVALVKVRIGSDAGGNPMFVEVVAKMHRRIPEGASVSWVTLCRKDGPVSRRRDENGRAVYRPYEHWSLQLTIETDEPKVRARKGCAGIDVGWKVMEDGSIRVASWYGEDPAGELKIHPRSADNIKIVKTEDGKEYGELRLLPTEVKKRIRKGQEVDVTFPSLVDRNEKCEDRRPRRAHAGRGGESGRIDRNGIGRKVPISTCRGSGRVLPSMGQRH